MKNMWMNDKRLQAIRALMSDTQHQMTIAEMNLRVARGIPEENVAPDPEMGDECCEEIAECHQKLGDYWTDLAAMRRTVRAEANSAADTAP